jgi:FkbM family methyltransferase
VAKVRSSFGGKVFRLRIDGKEDIYQALNILRPANSWNQLTLTGAPKTVVDLGANCGFSSLYWRIRYPAARLYGVEMETANIGRCRALFAENGLAGEFHQIAVGDRDGFLSFRSHSSHTRHRLDQLIGDDVADYSERTLVEVPARTFPSLLAELGLSQIDLLKVDIEGAEQFLIESVGSWAPAVKVMLLEIHHNVDQAWARSQLTTAGFSVDIGDSVNRSEWVCRNSTAL